MAVYVKDYYTIHCTGCKILIPKSVKQCSEYQKTLNVLCKRCASKGDTVSRTDPASHINFRWLSSHEKTDRLRCLSTRSKALQRQIKQVSEQAIEQCGIEVDNHLHEDLVTIMDDQPQTSDSGSHENADHGSADHGTRITISIQNHMP